MKTISTFIKKYPVLCYYLLTFVISWGGVYLVAGGFSGFPADAQQLQKLFPTAVLAMVAGPVTAGILMTGLVGGRAGLRDFLSRLIKWRVGLRWYAAALLTDPVVVGATLLALSLTSADFLPGVFVADNKATLLLSGLAAGLTAGIFEESGWTGFAIPQLRLRYSPFATGMIVGLLWGLWHFIVALWGGGTATGALAPVLFISRIAFYMGVLPAYRVLMVWVYDRTESLLVAMLMHGSLTAFTFYIFSPFVTNEQRLVYNLVLTGAMWIVVGAVALANRRSWSHSKRIHHSDA